MRNTFAAVLLGFAMVSSPVAAKAELEVYTAATTGELTIDGEGRVVDVSVDHKSLGDEVMHGYEQQMRQWRFEPIIENGQPVRAKAFMSLRLVAIRQPGVDGVRLAFESVQFRDPPTEGKDREISNGLAPPRYPSEEVARGIGAQVNLVLRLDGEGHVAEVATGSVDLYGEDVGSKPSRHAANFSRVSEKVAAGWRIPQYKDQVVTVPVRYYPPGARGERWIRTRSIAVDVPAWVALELSSDEVVALGAGGSRPSERWKLLTPLDG